MIARLITLNLILIIQCTPNLFAQEVNIEQAEKYYEQARTCMKNSQYEACRDYCRKALEVNPNFGNAYILMGAAYVSAEGGGETNIQKAALYWVAVDQFEKAKAVDSTLVEKANSLIKAYSMYFPMREADHNFREGAKYHVGCWINEETSVRTITTKH